MTKEQIRIAVRKCFVVAAGQMKRHKGKEITYDKSIIYWLDSLALVGFLADVEVALEENNIKINMTDEEVFTKRGPLHSLENLIDYITRKIQG